MLTYCTSCKEFSCCHSGSQIDRVQLDRDQLDRDHSLHALLIYMGMAFILMIEFIKNISYCINLDVKGQARKSITLKSNQYQCPIMV